MNACFKKKESLQMKRDIFLRITGSLVIFSLIFSACSKKISSKNKEIARIGSTIITADELRARAELTIRPPVVKTPEAVLNSLIAEKLLALEAGDTCALVKNVTFQAYIQGIREQSMREMLYNEVAVKKVGLEEAEVARQFDLSQKVYDVEFFTINNPEIAEEIRSKIDSGQMTPGRVFQEIHSSNESGVQTVKWRDPEHDAIHSALFSQPREQGDVIGPLRIAQDQWIMMRIQKSMIQPVIGPEDARMRMNEVKAKMTELKAKSIWQNYKNGIMAGKEMHFNPDVLKKIVQWYENQEQKDPNRIPKPEEMEKNVPDLDEMLDQPFFTLNGKTWTVADFKREIMSHPLVYRQDRVRPIPFREHLKQAVADLMVDHFLNEEAYKRNLDNRSEVKHEGKLWSDSFVAKYYLNQYLKKIKVGELQKKDPSYLGPRAVDEYLVQLEKKYGKRITIDEQALKQIELIKMPVFVYRPGMPYPVAVPEFPPYATADTLIFKSK